MPCTEMGIACSTCCDSNQNRDRECDMSNRKLPYKEHMTVPNSAETDIRRQVSRDSARKDAKNSHLNMEYSPRHADQQSAGGQSKHRNNTSQNPMGVDLSSPAMASRGASDLELLNGKGTFTLGLELSQNKSAVQDSKSGDPNPLTNQLSSTSKRFLHHPESPEFPDPASMVKPESHLVVNQEQENSSDLRSSLASNNLGAHGAAGSPQPNIIFVIDANFAKKKSAEGGHRRSLSKCKSMEGAAEHLGTPLGSGNHRGEREVGISVSLIPSPQLADQQGYLFSKQTAQHKLENSILRSSYNLGNDPSGGTIDLPEDGTPKEVLKILSYSEFAQIENKEVTDKKYQKAVIQLYYFV